MNDIVEQLRNFDTRTMDACGICEDAADEIERLRDVLRKWDALIRYQYNGSREAMSALQECAFETDAILKGYALGEKE